MHIETRLLVGSGFALFAGIGGTLWMSPGQDTAAGREFFAADPLGPPPALKEARGLRQEPAPLAAAGPWADPSFAKPREPWTEPVFVESREPGTGPQLPETVSPETVSPTTPTGRVPQKGDDPALFLIREITLGWRGPEVDLVSDRDRFHGLFVRRSGKGKVLDGARHLVRPDDAIRAGDTLKFGKGVFRLRNMMHYRRWFPRDVTIRGAGISETLLYMDTLVSQGPVHNLRIENCTVFTEGTFAAFHNGTATMRCEKVRFLGFDMEQDMRRVVEAAGAVMMFVDCRFEGGYGDYPTTGGLVGFHDPAVLMRFERCRFERMHLGVRHLPQRGTLVFSECVFEDLCDDPRRQGDGHRGIRLTDCRIQNQWLPEQRRRPLYLTMLFPRWRERMTR